MDWYLIYTKPKDEERVVQNLNGGNAICYFPKVKRKAFPRRGAETVVEPFFPRYIFVKTNIEENFWKIKYSRGVVTFVDFGDGPAVVDEKIIDKIRSRERDGFIQHTGNRRKYKKDDRITIKKGVMKDLDAVFEDYMSDGERVMLLLENVSSNIKVNIGTHDL